MISEIWYLARWFLRRRTPGAALSFLVDFLAPVVRFEEDLDGKKRSRRVLKEYGDSGAEMMVSQMMDSDWGRRVDSLSEEE